MGNPGDARGVGHGIFEMRIDYGPDYRIYDLHSGAQIVTWPIFIERGAPFCWKISSGIAWTGTRLLSLP
jgi:hypothetical protein